MKLGELIESGLIKDRDPIRLRKILYADVEMIKTGNWMNDQILEEMDMRVVKMRYVCATPGKAIWDIDLESQGEA